MRKIYCRNQAIMQRGRGGCSQGFGIAPRVLELLPRFWNCSQGFGIAPKVLELLPRFWNCSQGLELLPRFWSKSKNFIQPIMNSPLKKDFKIEIENRTLLHFSSRYIKIFLSWYNTSYC